jgi:hypothetical protein
LDTTDALIFSVAKDQGNQKVQPRLSPLMHRYLQDFVDGGFAKTKNAAAQKFIEDGIMAAIGKNLIDRRKAPRKRTG